MLSREVASQSTILREYCNITPKCKIICDNHAISQPVLCLIYIWQHYSTNVNYDVLPLFQIKYLISLSLYILRVKLNYLAQKYIQSSYGDAKELSKYGEKCKYIKFDGILT